MDSWYRGKSIRSCCADQRVDSALRANRCFIQYLAAGLPRSTWHDLEGLDEELVGCEVFYGPEKYHRVALKNKYDPTNLFRLNHNIIM
jgi:berberine-like enzyme